MTISRARDLQRHWQSDEQLQTAIGIALDKVGMTASFVGRCLRGAKSGRLARRSKQIKDNVWGMIEADWRAVRLIDCPVMQHLRQIKQLGVSYLTYPSAEHSRFVHSLGMYRVVREFLNSIDHLDGADELSCGQRVTCDGLAPVTRRDLLHAALLHDIGHMPFSHASEFALEDAQDIFRCGPHSVGEISGDVAIILGKNLHFSEVLTLLIILSERFQEYYGQFVLEGEDDPDALAKMACLISGLAPTPHLSGVPNIISASAVDADKIDYINRDARACGIPVGIDVARIFLRSAFVELTREELRRAELKDDAAEREIHFVVNASGVDTLDEVTQARSNLYQRVYLHPVTRTAEAVLASALVSAARAPNFPLNDALAIWALGDETLLATLAVRKVGAGDAARLVSKLRTRVLPKKACAFSASISNMQLPLRDCFPLNAIRNWDSLRKIVVNTNIESLSSKALKRPDIERVQGEIEAEVANIVRLLRGRGGAKLIPPGDLPKVFLIGAGYMQHVQKDCIVDQNGELLSSGKFTTAREQQDASDLFRAVGFVMTDLPAWAPLVLIASRTVLCRSSSEAPKPAVLEIADRGSIDATDCHLSSRIVLELSGVRRRSGVRKEGVEDLMRVLERIGYFDSMTHLSTPGPPSPAVTELAERLRAFRGQKGWRVTEASAHAFINQFPPSLREAAIDACSKIEVLDSAYVSARLASALERMGEVAAAPLSPSSGAEVIRDLIRFKKENPDRLGLVHLCNELREAISVPDNPIVLLDDNASSGVQSSAQLYALRHADRENWPEELRAEDGVYRAPLSTAEWSAFSSKPMSLLVCAGRAAANARLRAAANAVGLSKFTHLEVTQEIGSFSWPNELKDFLTQVGRDLVAWEKFRCAFAVLDDERKASVELNAFGYGGVGGLLTTQSSVPTATVTALWLPGLFRGAGWQPLLLRQNKLRNIVVS